MNKMAWGNFGQVWVISNSSQLVLPKSICTSVNLYPSQFVPGLTHTQVNLFRGEHDPKSTRNKVNLYPGELVPKSTWVKINVIFMNINYHLHKIYFLFLLEK